MLSNGILCPICRHAIDRTDSELGLPEDTVICDNEFYVHYTNDGAHVLHKLAEPSVSPSEIRFK